MKKFLKFTSVILMMLFVCTKSEAGVALGATRVIYPSDQKQVTLAITSSNNSDNFLVQSWIDSSDDKKDSRFVITPPLFLMQGKKENTLRIIDATGGSLPKDKESLFWINVKAIPSIDKQKAAKENTLQLAIVSRIKLFYRPVGLSMSPDKAPQQLKFNIRNGVLTVSNPSPYYITLTSLNAGTRILPNTMVPPMDKVEVKLPSDAGDDISYQTINDYGALTPKMKGAMQ